MIGTRVGNYEIKQKLGEGGMGAVYLGEHPAIGRRVAVKVLLEEYVSNETIAARFLNEAKAANDIRHQNIVDILDFGRIPKDDGRFIIYIVMELLEGESLAARLESRRLELDEVRHIMQQCCSGLAASHAKGIIHRDLKPDNLFLLRRGADPNFVKILDFGIAKLTASSSTNAKTRTGTLIGTPSYMSPEQCAGRGQIDARADVYSLGIVLYEMLTGEVPFKGEGFGDIVVAHLTEPPRPPTELRPDLPKAWEAVVLRALEKEPDKRFQSMDEMALALGNPEAYAARPEVVAQAGAAAAAPTTSVPVVEDAPSGPRAVAPSSEMPTLVSKKADATAASATPEATTATRKAESTTLSHAASEVRPPARGSSRAALIAGAVVVAAAGLALVMSRVSRAPSAPAPQSPAVTQSPMGTRSPVGNAAAAVVPPPAAPAQVTVKLTSDPAGASVLREDQGDKVVGATPLTLTLPKGAPAFAVTLRLDGYRPETRTLTSDVNREIDVNLLPQPGHARAHHAAAEHAPKATAAPADKPAAEHAPKATAAPADKPAAAPAARPASKPAPTDEDKKLIAPVL